MPVILVHGDEDTAVPVDLAREWAAKLRELNMTHEYHEIAGGDHVDVIGIGMPDIFRALTLPGILGARPSNRCDGHITSCCAPTLSAGDVMADLDDGDA